MGLREWGHCAPAFSESHEAVSIISGDFGLYPNLPAGNLFKVWQNVDLKTQTLPWGSEADVQTHVNNILVALLKFLRLNTQVVRLHEFSVFQERKDIWLVRKVSGMPMGIIKIKKPRADNVEFTKNIAGEMFDYLLRLQSFYGLQFAFGIATTVERWQIFWLEPSISYASKTQRPSQELVKEETVEEAGIAEEASDCHEVLQVEDTIKRNVYVSRMYNRDDKDTVNALMTALVKMYESPVSPVVDASNERPYIVLSKDAWEWRKIKWLKTVLNRTQLPDLDCQALVLLRDLRGGAEGRVWMACSTSGSACVIKFAKIELHITSEESLLALALSEAKNKLEHEVAMYAQNGIEARVVTLGGRPALLMHHYSKTDLSVAADREGAREAVESAFNNGIFHRDVKPEHVVCITPTKKTEKRKYTLIDMGMSEKIAPTASKEEKEAILNKMLAGLSLNSPQERKYTST